MIRIRTPVRVTTGRAAQGRGVLQHRTLRANREAACGARAQKETLMKSLRALVAITALGSLLLTATASQARDQCVELPSGTATINGTVKSQATAAAVFASVTATAEIDGYGPASFSGFAAIGGAFSIQVAAPATYVIVAAPVDFVHAPELYNGTLTNAAATEISVTPGQVVNGIDFTVLTGSSISGTVTEEGSGDPIEGASVSASSLGDLFAFGFALTDENGDYTIPGLALMPYQVGFFPDQGSSELLSEFYDDKPGAPGDPVNVTQPGVTGIDAALATGGRVEGTVTGSGGPLESVGVVAVASGGSAFAGDSTDAAGNYSLLVPAGSVNVLFAASDGFVSEYYNNKPDFASADDVSVTSGATTSNIDADLAASGKITGVVTDSTTDDPVEDVTVIAFDSNGVGVTSAATNGSGIYELDGNLKTGTYRVQFLGPDPEFGGSPGYTSRFYSNKTTLGNATAVSVTAPATTPNIDQELTPCDEVGGSTTTSTTGDTTTTTLGGATECGDPVALVVGAVAPDTADAVTASDALFVLRTGIGLSVCQLCVCDVNDSGGITATDALTILRAAVGQPVTLDCPVCT